MPAKNAEDLGENDRITLGEQESKPGKGAKKFKVKNVTRLPPGGVDEVALLVEDEDGQERILSVGYGHSFEVPAW